MYVELGKIVGVWGVKGWVKLHSFTRNRKDIAQYQTWTLSRRKKGPEFDSHAVSIDVMQCREQAKGIVAQLRDVDDRDQAADMAGLGIWVKQSELPDLPDGEYYWQQLIGLAVKNTDQTIGVVDSILETGANDVLVCKSDVEGAPDVLVPYTDEVVLEVDLETGELSVDWDPEYLLD